MANYIPLYHYMTPSGDPGCMSVAFYVDPNSVQADKPIYASKVRKLDGTHPSPQDPMVCYSCGGAIFPRVGDINKPSEAVNG